MPTVTVLGAGGSTAALSYDSGSNAILAQQIARAINAGVVDGSVAAADNKYGPPPPVPSGDPGEYVLSKPGVAFLPQGYDDVVNNTSSAVVFGSGDPNEAILSGAGKLAFYASEGSGSVVAGGGNNLINIAATDPGDWLIAVGNGDNIIRAAGAGNDTISTGSGHNAVQLGAGVTEMTSGGNDTILAGTGSETIAALGAGAAHATDVVYGNASNLFLSADGGATVFGGAGSDSVFGGTGPDLLEGGSAGNNFLQAGSGGATLFGGGDGDQLFAGGGAPQELHAGGGNETLFGGFASGQDTFYAGTGTDQIYGSTGQSTFVLGAGSGTITAAPSDQWQALFDVVKGNAGGTFDVQGLTDASQLKIQLSGYKPHEIAEALAGQTTNGSSVTVTLSDSTKITFENITHLTKSNFS